MSQAPPSLYDQILDALRPSMPSGCPSCDIYDAAEAVHALIIEIYGPPF